MNSMRIGDVAIVMMSAVGDAVHVLPVINAIKRRHPGSRITWILQPGPAELVRGHPSVDELIVFERARGLAAFFDIRRRLQQRSFDLALNLQVYFKAGLVTSFVKAPVKLGFDRRRARDLNWLFTTHRIPPSPPAHVQDQYFEFLRYLDIDPEPVEWRLGPWPEEREWQRQFFSQFDRPVAALVVATSKPEKDWPAERWAKLCDILAADFGLQPVLVGGRSRRELEAEAVIMAEARTKPYSALGSGLRRLVSVLEGAAVVISPDTGPLHMAVALGTPVVGLYGYTNPKRTGPYRSFGDLVVDAYGDPNENYPVSMQTRPGRMSRIGVDDVVQKLRLWEARYRSVSSRSALR
jgi:heptosyltransferase I